MRFWTWCVLLATTLVAPAASAQEGRAPWVVGSWRLLAFELHAPSGEVTQPFGESPLGSLVYTGNGRMSVHLLEPDRPAFVSGDFQDGSDAEVRAAFEGYFGYFGAYTVEVVGRDGEAVTGTVTHHVEGCAFPDYIGTDRVRTMSLEGDRLTLSTPREENGAVINWYRVVWERIR
jgi:hypothetical protein